MKNSGVIKLLWRIESEVWMIFLDQILAQEVIGYHNVSLVALDDPRVGFDPVTQFGYISSCTDSR